MRRGFPILGSGPKKLQRDRSSSEFKNAQIVTTTSPYVFVGRRYNSLCSGHIFCICCKTIRFLWIARFLLNVNLRLSLLVFDAVSLD